MEGECPWVAWVIRFGQGADHTDEEVRDCFDHLSGRTCEQCNALDDGELETPFPMEDGRIRDWERGMSALMDVERLLPTPRPTRPPPAHGDVDALIERVSGEISDLSKPVRDAILMSIRFPDDFPAG